jgi:ABC-type transport system involved in cytochrome c biogenesis permease subunit
MKDNGVPMELGWKFVHVLKSNQSIMFGLIAITGLSVVLFGMWGMDDALSVIVVFITSYVFPYKSY